MKKKIVIDFRETLKSPYLINKKNALLSELGKLEGDIYGIFDPEDETFEGNHFRRVSERDLPQDIDVFIQITGDKSLLVARPVFELLPPFLLCQPELLKCLLIVEDDRAVPSAEYTLSILNNFNFILYLGVGDLNTEITKRCAKFSGKRRLWNEGISAIFAPLPPMESGIAQYTYDSLKNIKNLHFYYSGRYGADFKKIKSYLDAHEADITLFSIDTIKVSSQIYRYKKAVFILGNSSHHVESIRALFQYGHLFEETILYLHDINLSHLWLEFFKSYDGLSGFYSLYYSDSESTRYGVRPLLSNGKVKKIFCNSKVAKKLLRSEVGSHIEICDLFLPIIEREKGKKNTSSTLNVAHFGILNPHKHTPILFDACAILIGRGIKLNLIFCGYRVMEGFKCFISENLPDWVTIVDSPDETTFINVMSTIDIAVQLRWPSTGESSGVICDLLGLEKKIITTAETIGNIYGDAVVLTPTGINSSKLADVIQNTMAIDLSKQILSVKSQFSIERFGEKFNSSLR